jgi:hypothetical protein
MHPSIHVQTSILTCGVTAFLARTAHSIQRAIYISQVKENQHKLTDIARYVSNHFIYEHLTSEPHGVNFT